MSKRPANADSIPFSRVAAVVPAYRARDTIARVVAGALAVVDIVIVVDDACPEMTGDAVRDLDPRVYVIRHEINRGVGGAMKTGIAKALSLGADFIVKIDADGQMDTGFVPDMIAVLNKLRISTW